MNTIDENDFQGIGKKTPYETPDGFFDQVSETILQKAKQREQNRKKYLVLWRSVAVAASLIGIALVGYYVFEPEKLEIKVVAVQEKQVDSTQIVRPIQEEVQKQAKSEIKLKESDNTMKKENNQEDLKDVLADLSDEELLQLAAMYKSDPFINESEQ